MYYNFVRLHQTLKVSPAMAAGVTDRLWEMTDVVDMLDAFEAKRNRKYGLKSTIGKSLAASCPCHAREWHGRADQRLCDGRRGGSLDQE